MGVAFTFANGTAKLDRSRIDVVVGADGTDGGGGDGGG